MTSPNSETPPSPITLPHVHKTYTLHVLKSPWSPPSQYPIKRKGGISIKLWNNRSWNFTLT